MVTETYARALFEELAAIARRSDALLMEIIETKAWEVLGYPTLLAAWDFYLGDYFVLGKRTRLEVQLQLAKEDSTPSQVAAVKVGGVPWWSTLEVRTLLESGVPEEEIREVVNRRSGSINHVRPKTYQRVGGPVSYPERPYRITVEFTNAEVEQFKRVAEARGSSITTEAKRAIQAHFERLEAGLRVSV